VNKSQLNEIATDGTDIKLLSSLIVEFNIVRRNFRAYPQDHPIIETSLNRLIDIYGRLVSQDKEVVIGVARDALMIGDALLDRNNLVFRDFAKTLFEHGIGALILRSGLSAGELRSFNRILNLKRDEVNRQGGITALWDACGMTSLVIKPIRYDLFSVTEDLSDASGNGWQPSQGLWERFVGRLVRDPSGPGSAGPIVAAGGGDEIDPQLLAEILNRQMAMANDTNEADFSKRVVSTFAEVTRDQTGTPTEAGSSYEKLAIFISSLNPELRRRLLDSSFDISTLSRSSLGEEIVPRLSTTTVVETLEDIQHNRFTVPPTIMNILQSMSRNVSQQSNAATGPQNDETGIHHKIRSIFREHATEDFTPDSYQEKLGKMLSIEQQSLDNEYPGADLMATLDNHCVENRISDIILRMMILGIDPAETDQLVGNLSEMYVYLLQTGDYEQLIYLVEQGENPEIPALIRERLRRYYSSPAFLEELLAGLTIWGKTRYEDIIRLINLIGEPCINVLLDRLSEEESLSLRRFLMDRILEFGTLARDAMIERLSDSRWYVLRNLIVMLRLLDDSTILDRIHPLLKNPHQRVRQEALRFCLQFHDPAAERQIIQDLDSPDRETQLSAIHLAERSRSADVFKKLLAIINRSGFSIIECELKSAAVHSLAEIGRVDAIPELARVLSSWSLLNARPLSRLKIDIVRSLCNYPPAVAAPILKKLSLGRDAVARQAALSLKTLTEKTT